MSKINLRKYVIKGKHDPLNCPYCNSKNIIKSGRKYSKSFQYIYCLYKCNECNKKFIWNNDNLGMRHDIDDICEAMSLLSEGMSLRKTAKELEKTHGEKVSHVTIKNWKAVYYYKEIYEQQTA